MDAYALFKLENTLFRYPVRRGKHRPLNWRRGRFGFLPIVLQWMVLMDVLLELQSTAGGFGFAIPALALARRTLTVKQS